MTQYSEHVWNKTHSEFFESTKFGKFLLSQGLIINKMRHGIFGRDRRGKSCANEKFNLPQSGKMCLEECAIKEPPKYLDFVS